METLKLLVESLMLMPEQVWYYKPQHLATLFCNFTWPAVVAGLLCYLNASTLQQVRNVFPPRYSTINCNRENYSMTFEFSQPVLSQTFAKADCMHRCLIFYKLEVMGLKTPEFKD